jgi:CzcA family heavy metal efflux pump
MPSEAPEVVSAAIDSSQKSFWLARSTRTIFFFAAMLTVAGIYLAFKVPISVFPETDFPRVIIAVDNGVMPVEQMEVTITRPVEDAINSVPGLQTVRSTTSRGTAEVSLFFEWNVNMITELQLVDAALAQVQQSLPATVHISTKRLTFASFPILGYSLTSDTVPMTRLWEIATYNLKPPLNRVPGVSTVIVQGGQVPEFHVVPNLALMQAAGVTIPDLAGAIEASNIIDSPGLYEANHQLILGLVGAQVHNIDEIRQLVVKTTATGAPVRLADVATVEDGTLPVYTTVTSNGKKAVLLSLTRQPTSNTVAVADAVATQVTELRKKLPPGVKLDVFYDQSQLVKDAISSVRDAIFIGLILSCVILFLFLRDWTSSLIAGLVIPVTIAVTILFLWVMGESFNLMTLGGLAAAIGLVIDDAIVMVENIVMHRDSGEPRAEAVRKALRELMTPLIGSTITPVVVFLPLISVSGVTGLFFRALAVTMTAALLTSLALALTWTPGLSYVLLREDRVHSHDHSAGRLLTKVLSVHHRVLDWVLAKPLWTGAICLLLVIGTYFGYQSLGSDLLPKMDEGSFILDYIMPAGSSLAETDRVLDHVERILHKIPEVDNTSRRTGLQLGYAAVTEANTGDFTVKLKPRRSRSVEDVMSEVRDQIKKTEPALDIELFQILQDNINDLSNAPEPIQVKIFSNDEQLLTTLGPTVGDAIEKIPGVVDMENGIENTISGPATSFQVNPSVASRLGFTPQEASEDATSILDGIATSAPLIANGHQYTIRVRLGDEHRKSLDAISETVFNSASGHAASLGSLATIQQLPPQNEIRRENLQRMAVVTANLEGSDLGTAITKVKQVVANLDLPSSVRVEYGGTYEEQQKSFRDLLQVLMLALALVFGVLLAEFRNFEAPLAILTSSILSISGVILALLITGTTFNVASFMGVIMVIGIVAKNGILLLDADEKFRAEGTSPRDAMMHAAQRRLRPIVMTALAAVCGMLPLAFAIGAGSQMLQPLAIAVIGGLCISMVLSLVITPLVYYLLTRNRAERVEEVV